MRVIRCSIANGNRRRTCPCPHRCGGRTSTALSRSVGARARSRSRSTRNTMAPSCARAPPGTTRRRTSASTNGEPKRGAARRADARPPAISLRSVEAEHRVRRRRRRRSDRRPRRNGDRRLGLQPITHGLCRVCRAVDRSPTRREVSPRHSTTRAMPPRPRRRGLDRKRMPALMPAARGRTGLRSSCGPHPPSSRRPPATRFRRRAAAAPRRGPAGRGARPGCAWRPRLSGRRLRRQQVFLV